MYSSVCVKVKINFLIKIARQGNLAEIAVEPRNPSNQQRPSFTQEVSALKKQNFKIRRISFLGNNNVNFLSGEKVLNRLYQKQKGYIDTKLTNIDPKAKKKLLAGCSPTNKDNGITKMREESEEESNSLEGMSNIGPSEHDLQQEEEKHIIEAISNHFVFKDINQELLSLVLNDLIYFQFDKGQTIYAEGDEGNYFYIIAEGKVESTAKGKKNKIYGQWDCFGELSLITRCKREETLKCLEKVVVFSIDGESFRDFQKRINEQILKERYNFINTIAIFESLDQVNKYNVLEKITLKTFEQSAQIISRGEVGDTLYIIKEGLVSCRIGVKEVRKLGNNDYFGQNAILIDVKRGCDVFALKTTMCYELSRKDLKEALGPDYIDVILYCYFRNCIQKNDYLKDIFIESNIHEIYKAFKIKTYAKNEKISSTSVNQNGSKQGENNNKKIIVVIDGSLYKEKSFELIGDRGKVIGEDILRDITKSLPDDVIAHPDCIALEANVEDLSNIMKIDYNNLKPLHILNRISKLKKLYLFKNLSEKTLELLAKQLTKRKYEPRDVIVKEGDTADSFFLISKGRVKITMKGKELRDLDSGSCFGENALLRNEKRSATVSAIDQVTCYELSKKEFDFIVNDKTIKDYLLKKITLQDTSITLSDLHYIKFLGKGKFGSVSLVHNKKNIYAIKAVSRLSVDRQKILAKYFVNERRVMLSLDHPFIVKMVKSMRNQYFCFFLIEFVNGKNLDEYLSSRVIKTNVYETQFYVGSMLLMLEYLQKKYIAHRDIKPSNIMVDSNGYLKMIDFGTAKQLTDYTSTVIGTPHYIAPEILKGKGYSLSCDFWSVGICMYEIFYGMYPFGHFATEVIEIYKDILHMEFSFPVDSEKYGKVNRFIKDLLTKKVNMRICNVSILKKRPFFDDFDWDKLNDFKLIPPYIPPHKDLSDQLTIENPYEKIVSEDNTHYSKKDKSDVYPSGYDRKWADEF